jgi:hypothetical protein
MDGGSNIRDMIVLLVSEYEQQDCLQRDNWSEEPVWGIRHTPIVPRRLACSSD